MSPCYPHLPKPPTASCFTSVSTMMHETFLPLYLVDELHLSHSGASVFKGSAVVAHGALEESAAC